MANTLNQSIMQITTSPTGNRVVVQYTDDTTNENKQAVVNYDDLTAQQKIEFDNFVLLCETIMNS